MEYLLRKNKILPIKNKTKENQKKKRKEKKDFLNEQCKEIEENNRMGKTRDLFKKIGNINGIFPAKMGTIKDRSSKDLTKAEEIKKSWQEYTEELYKKGLGDHKLWSLTWSKTFWSMKSNEP